jgi:acyl-CoA thioesterase
MIINSCIKKIIAQNYHESHSTGMLKNHTKKQQKSTGPHDVVLKEWISCAPFESLLQMQIIEAKESRATLTMPFLHEFAQGAGLMHGGALISLADTAVVMAIKSGLSPDTHFATIHAESKFLYPVKKGIVTAKAQAEFDDERTIHGTATVFDENEKPVLEFHSTFKIAGHRQIKKYE